MSNVSKEDLDDYLSGNCPDDIRSFVDVGIALSKRDAAISLLMAREMGKSKKPRSFYQLIYSLCKQYISWYEREIKGV